MPAPVPLPAVIVITDRPRVWPPVLLGTSVAAREQQRQVAAAEADSAPVLILAEPGLDAARVAEVLHARHRPQPWQALDCGQSSTENLSERLFGRPEPAARHRRDLDVLSRRSAVVAAGGGTLFLANVSEMGAPIQRRLARVLRDGEVYLDDRVQPVALQVRIVASALPDLLSEVDARRFAPGLYRRLSASQITLAPLRHRPEDIPDIVRAISVELAERKGIPAREFTPAALTALASLAWPRNLDELRELLDRLHGGQPTGAARQEDVLRALGLGHAPPVSAATRFDSLRLARQRFEREYIAAVLERHGWRMAEAAVTLGIERANLYRKIRQLGLPRPPHGAAGEH